MTCLRTASFLPLLRTEAARRLTSSGAGLNPEAPSPPEVRLYPSSRSFDRSLRIQSFSASNEAASDSHVSTISNSNAPVPYLRIARYRGRSHPERASAL